MDGLTSARPRKAVRPSYMRQRIVSRAVNVISIGQLCGPIRTGVLMT
jgi:hypothetical protein